MPRTTDAGTSPPAALGSVAGLGETFRMNLNTGQGVYSYTLPVPDGVAKHTPKLSLEYAHGNRQGPYGSISSMRDPTATHSGCAFM